jgi:hypothetical protein
MGSIFLTWLADDLEAAGLQVVRYDGWTERARGSGGYAHNPLCCMWHHTASLTSPANDSYYMCHGSSDRPIANLLIARDGVVWVLAAGATNTNGKGRDLIFTRGTVPIDKMNEHAVGMEIANDGLGEPYLQQQIDAAFVVSNVINARLGNQPSDVCTHQHYAPDRKIDPARGSSVQGPWQPGEINSSGSWDRSDLQDECLWRAGPPPEYAQGIDVSKWQGRIDWRQVQAAGYTWCATRTWDRDHHQVDETFHYNRDGMAFAQWRLLYYWLEPGRVEVGVDEFFAAVGELRPGEGVMLDAEEDGIDEDQCVRWLEAVEARTGIPCAVYTGAYAAGGTLWRSSRIFNGQRARIIAAYCSEEEARDHADGIAWDAWQYSSKGSVPGIGTHCDLDRIDNPDAFTRCCRPSTQEDDLTPEQAQQLSQLHTALTTPIYADRFKDPGGVPLSVPWASGWTWEYVSVNIDQKLSDIIARLDRLEQQS